MLTILNSNTDIWFLPTLIREYKDLMVGFSEFELGRLEKKLVMALSKEYHYMSVPDLLDWDFKLIHSNVNSVVTLEGPQIYRSFNHYGVESLTKINLVDPWSFELTGIDPSNSQIKFSSVISEINKKGLEGFLMSDKFKKYYTFDDSGDSLSVSNHPVEYILNYYGSQRVDKTQFNSFEDCIVPLTLVKQRYLQKQIISIDGVKTFH